MYGAYALLSDAYKSRVDDYTPNNSNLTFQEFHTLVDELISSHYLKQTDSLVFAVLTHGDFEKGKQYIEFTDGSLTTVQDILEKFNNINCRNMVGKPKIFLFPMCR